MIDSNTLRQTIIANVQAALVEDVGEGDITAGLIDLNAQAQAVVIGRESFVLCGIPWVQAIFEKLDENLIVLWHFKEGELVPANAPFLELKGNARAILTGERAALNFIQTLSAVATKVHLYASRISDYHTKILDTRKTIPGLRVAQKYAVGVGGGQNHRMGLYDAFLIKENHILAAGSITKAVASARLIAPNKPVEVEVENFAELNEALSSQADIIMLDNFSYVQMTQAVDLVKGRCKLEASGNITLDNLEAVAKTGVDYISMGTLTKDVKAIDLSMRIHH